MDYINSFAVTLLLNIAYKIKSYYVESYLHKCILSILKMFQLTCKYIDVVYANSILFTCIRFLTSSLKRVALGSKICKIVFFGENTNLGWESSISIMIVRELLNKPVEWAMRLFNGIREYGTYSIAIKTIFYLLIKLDMLIAYSIVLILLVPANVWYNAYSTVIIFTIFILFFLKNIVCRYPKFNVTFLGPTLLMFIVSVIMSQLTSIAPELSTRFFIMYVSSCFIIVLILTSTLTSNKSIDKFVSVVLLGISIIAIYGVWQHITNSIPLDPSLVDIGSNQGSKGRVFSTFGNPNNFAEVLVLTMPFFWAIILNATSFLKKSIYACLNIPVVIALFLTGSRIGFIAFVLLVVVFVFMKNKKLIPVVIVGAIVSIPFIPQYIWRRIMTIFGGMDSSMQYRVAIIKTSIPALKDFWWTGIGLGTDVFMKLVGGKYYSFIGGAPLHTHCIYLQLWIEMGIAGIVTFLWFMFSTIKNSIFTIFKTTDSACKNFLIAGLSAMVGILTIGCVEYIWYYPRTMLCFWIIVGIILSTLSVAATRRKKEVLK